MMFFRSRLQSRRSSIRRNVYWTRNWFLLAIYLTTFMIYYMLPIIKEQAIDIVRKISEVVFRPVEKIDDYHCLHRLLK